MREKKKKKILIIHSNSKSKFNYGDEDGLLAQKNVK